MEGGHEVAGGIPTRLSRAEGRRFGFVVGTAFLVLGTLLWWRGQHFLASVLGMVGVALIFVGGLVPTALGPLHRIWMGVAVVISKVTSPVFLAFVYFAIITPIGVARRLFGHDTLKDKRGNPSLWVPRNEYGRGQSDMERQF